MPSSSGSSNSGIDRILARVDYSPTQAPPSPTPHVGVDTAGLGAIGAHLPLGPENIYPGHIDFPNEPHVPLQAYQSPPSPTLPSLQTLSSYVGGRAGALPPTPTLTPTESAPYLSFEEYLDFMHRRADDQCRNDHIGTPSEASSPSTHASTVSAIGDHDTHIWATPERSIEDYIMMSPRITPPRSFTTTEDDAHRAGEGPGLEGPWSVFGRKNDE